MGLKLLTEGKVKPSELRRKTKRVHDKVNAMLATSLWSGDGKEREKEKTVSLGSIFENVSSPESPYIHIRMKQCENRAGIPSILHQHQLL
jgi:hypothetical protein